MAIDAFANVAGRFPRAKLIIAGDGRERAALERQVADRGIANAVEITGWVAPEQIPSLMNSATIVAIPSRWREPFPLVAIQAAQMARPIVCSRIGGLPEFALATLLADPHTATKMGNTARRRAHDEFGWEQCVSAFDRLYRELAQTQ